MIVLDSSFLVAFHNSRDVHHQAAAAVMADLLGDRWGRGLLLEYVFLEVVTVIMARRGPSAADSVAGVLIEARELELVPCSGLFLDAVDTFRGQRDTRLSFVDAAIVNVARTRADGLVATFDSELSGLEGISSVPS
jgi:predicted nucleic acid-binding protein